MAHDPDVAGNDARGAAERPEGAQIPTGPLDGLPPQMRPRPAIHTPEPGPIHLDEDFVTHSAAFEGMDPRDVDDLLNELGATVVNYKAGEVILEVGTRLEAYPIILKGTVRATMFQDDVYRTITTFSAGHSFAEAVPESIKFLPVDVWAEEDASILMVPADRLKEADVSPASSLRSNLMHGMSDKLAVLVSNITVIGEPRLQQRILVYVRTLPKDDEGWATLPFSQQEWATHLRVDSRSLSRKLTAMRREGLIEYHDGRIRIIDDATSH